MDHVESVFSESIRQADMILAGIGEEMSADVRKAEATSEFGIFIKNLQAEEAWMLPFIQKLYLMEYPVGNIKDAYQKLENILEGRNYFIVSVNTDDYIYDTKLKNDRVVTPCGGYRYMQCASGCAGQLRMTEQQLLRDILDCVHGRKKKEKLIKPVCESCGSDMAFNYIHTENYVEEGYLPQWNRYRTWLQGTVNRKLCVLELGVGMQFPAVIRWPFEKAVYLNQKSTFFRVHSRLFQLTEEIRERGYAVKENPVDFLARTGSLFPEET